MAKFARVVPRYDDSQRIYALHVELDGRILEAVATHGIRGEWDYLQRRMLGHIEHELGKLSYVAFQDLARRNEILPYRRR